MKREKCVGNYCKRCEYTMPLFRTDCRCTGMMTEVAASIHREMHWTPAYVRLTVTMESANRG